MCPVKCRVTFKKKRKQFSTGISINPKEWDNKNQTAIPPDIHNHTNTQLSLIKTKLSQAFLFLQVNQQEFSVDDILAKYKGESTSKEIGVVEAYKLFLKHLKKLVDKELNQATYDKYVVYGKHLQQFLKKKFNTSDILLKELKSPFITQYEYFLKTELNFAQSTINKVLQRFRRMIRFTIAEEYLSKDPFLMYKAKTVRKEVLFLTKKQLADLEQQEFPIKRIEQIKDLFIFCCYTGLAFKEMANLKKTHIQEGFDGNLWLTIYRDKTQRTYKVPVLPKAQIIIEKYNTEPVVHL